MTRECAPTLDDLRAITEQVWASYLDPHGVSPLLVDVPLVSPGAHQEVSAAVAVTGAWSGHVLVTCSATASRRAAAAFLGLTADEVSTEDAVDAMGEVANVIGGNVKSLLPELCVLGLPETGLTASGLANSDEFAEVCRLEAIWLDEPVVVTVLESTVVLDERLSA